MSTKRYREEDFEDHIAGHLTTSGYHLLPTSAYDKSLVLLPEEIIAFVKATQPDAYDRLQAQYGDDTDRNLALRVARETERYGTLHVLRKGVKDRGVQLRLVYFRPASGLNPEHAVDLDSFRLQQMYEGQIALADEDAHLTGIPTDTGSLVSEPEMAYLSDSVTTLNETFGIDLTEKDQVRVEEIAREVKEDEGVQAVMAGNNSMSNKRHKVHQAIDDRLLDQVHHSIDLYKKLNDPQVKAALKARLFEQLLRQFAQSER